MRSRAPRHPFRGLVDALLFGEPPWAQHPPAHVNAEAGGGHAAQERGGDAQPDDRGHAVDSYFTVVVTQAAGGAVFLVSMVVRSPGRLHFTVTEQPSGHVSVEE